MRSDDESLCLYCKVTTFADGNHTLAYVTVRILSFVIGFAACQSKNVECWVILGWRLRLWIVQCWIDSFPTITLSSPDLLFRLRRGRHSLLQFKTQKFNIAVGDQFKTQNSKFKTQTAAPPLRFPQVFRYELYFAWREPPGCLPIALGDEGIVEGFATADPRHEVVDCHVGSGWREIQEGKLLLGVGLDGESDHNMSAAILSASLLSNFTTKRPLHACRRTIYSSSLARKSSSYWRATRIIASTKRCNWPFPPAERVTIPVIKPQSFLPCKVRIHEFRFAYVWSQSFK